MGFFTVGNFLTLGIVLLVLVMYRSMDKRSRILEKVRKYADKLREELSAFVDEREGTVKNLGIELKVEQEAAKELMNRIQKENEELAEKASIADRIDQRLNTYDASLEELVRMTARVQENLTRIRDESAFVDGAYRRVTEAKTAMEGLESSLESMEIRFKQDNLEALKNSSEEVVSGVRSVISDLQAQAESIENQIEEHRDDINKIIEEHRSEAGRIEQSRTESLNRDMETVNKTLKTAVEQAALRADRMEEAALVKLREQARERIEKIKTTEEERIQNYQESARNRVTEIQGLVKIIRDEWRAERQDWETREKGIKETCKNNIQEIKSLTAETENKISAETGALEKRLENLKTSFNQTLSGHEAILLKAAEDMKQKALEVTASRLEEYREAQNAEFKHLEVLAEDSHKLDSELRRYMQDTVARVRDEFSLYVNESARERQKTAAEFSTAAQALKTQMGEVETELARLKAAAYENVSEKLEGFENEFLSELEQRSADMNAQLTQWQGNLENRLSELNEEETEKRQKLEQDMAAELRRELAAQNQRIVSELDKLKTETGAFEEGIRGQMNAADISLASYREELVGYLEDAREAAETGIKAEIGNLSLSTAETFKLTQRDLEGKLRDIAEYTENQSKEIQDLLDQSRRNIMEQDNRIVSVRTAMDDMHREAESRRDDILTRTSEQAKILETGIREAERQIKEFYEQAKIIDHTDELRFELNRHIEDLRADMDRLEQRRAETTQLENQFGKIRRLEDEVNAKMTRFLSEKHRIEQMDTDFNRLLLTSRAVEEKLKEVSASDDMLQQVQLQIRKIAESLGETEERYLRIEKKNQVLDTTNDGIDRNFKDLQDSEKTIKKVNTELDRISEDIQGLHDSIDTLASQSEKAKETAEQMVVLDTALTGIEERIVSMQKAREWIGKAETRLEEINNEILGNLRLLGTVQREKGKKASPEEQGAPSTNVRESVIKLSTKGWKVEEIAKTLKLSRSEVELILEISPRE